LFETGLDNELGPTSVFLLAKEFPVPTKIQQRASFADAIGTNLTPRLQSLLPRANIGSRAWHLRPVPMLQTFFAALTANSMKLM
jgi:hypothetical protein